MDFNEVRKLVKLVEGAAISSLEIEEEGLAIRIEKTLPADEALLPAAPQVIPAQAAPAPAAPAPAAPAEAAPQATPEPAPKAGGVEVRSPMVGTFYAAPNPESPDFVKVGDTVKKGQTLCILEAMKIMNEIEAEEAGTIVEILVENSQPVQFDQVLFRIQP